MQSFKNVKLSIRNLMDPFSKHLIYIIRWFSRVWHHVPHLHHVVECAFGKGDNSVICATTWCHALYFKIQYANFHCTCISGPWYPIRRKSIQYEENPASHQGGMVRMARQTDGWTGSISIFPDSMYAERRIMSTHNSCQITMKTLCFHSSVSAYTQFSPILL